MVIWGFASTDYRQCFQYLEILHRFSESIVDFDQHSLRDHHSPAASSSILAIEFYSLDRLPKLFSQLSKRQFSFRTDLT